MSHDSGVMNLNATRRQRYIRAKVLDKLQNLNSGRLVVTDPLGNFEAGDGVSAPINLDIHNLDFYSHLALRGSIGAAESYMNADWDCNDLTALVRLMVANIDVSDELDQGSAWLRNSVLKLWHLFNRNSFVGSRKNISAHYDLGNDFFSLFLDRHMMYSSAIFTDKTPDLESASDLKLKTICSKLNLSEDDHLVEIGTGWGGLAAYAASTTGCRVTTTTISREQHAHAVERVRAAGLEDRVTVLMQDYRTLEGQFDKLVSIEMIEAVGHQFLPTYLLTCQNLLKPDGLGLIQAITIDDQRYKQALKSVDFIKRYIFPGSFIPCVSVIVNTAAESTDLRLINLEDFGDSYAKTLNVWHQRFNQNRDAVLAQGFDDRFIRMWNWYLCYCEGGFMEKQLSDVHLLFARSGNRRDQWLALQA